MLCPEDSKKFQKAFTELSISSFNSFNRVTWQLFFFPIWCASSEIVGHGNGHRIVTACLSEAINRRKLKSRNLNWFGHTEPEPATAGKIVSPQRLHGREDRQFWA